ncbi:YciI family protein [Roseibium aggregatum]|uniref:YCII-related domain-containing protein n=1 Tax=Roseibium aggregatum TaxID=187304 RepID=A0A939EAW8_9HYPH|nr:YciI family protein [Roseibium aggregatum]MBN9669262.1 hypothetical protein [Roseibium aggregatum]
MLYTIRFLDNAGADPEIRMRHMRQHLAFLSANKDAIRAAGPLKEDDGTVKSGLWLVDVETVEQAWDLVKADPFWPTGLRDKVEIRQWTQVFAGGQCLIDPE